MIKDFPCPGRAADRYSLSLARNERETMQVAVIPVAGPRRARADEARRLVSFISSKRAKSVKASTCAKA